MAYSKAVRLIWIILCMHMFTGLKAAPEYYFKQLSLQEGLSQSTVHCILSDSKGLIWIGTKFGLNSYDRNTIKSYFHQEHVPFSIPDNEINFIAEDSLLNIWVGTERGMVLYNKEKDNFIPVMFKEQPVTAHSYFLRKEGILFGGDGELFFYHYRTKHLEQLKLKTNEKVWGYFKTIKRQNAHTLLLNTRWNGVWQYDLNTHALDRCPFIKEKEIASILVDSEENIWVSPYGKGVYCYDKKGRLLRWISSSSSSSGLNNSVILDLLEKDGELWMATDGGGINILNLKTNSIRTIQHAPGELYSLPVNSVLCLYTDNEDNIWAGTIRGGLIGIKEVYIKTYKDAPLNTVYGLSDKTVICIHEDKNGIVWIGTDGGGINRLNPRTNTFTHYPSTYMDKVVSITDFTDDELLLSLFGKGVYIFNKHTGKSIPLPVFSESERNRIFRSGKSIHINLYRKNKLQLLGDSVYLYDMETKNVGFVSFERQPARLSSLQKIYSNEYVTYLMGEHCVIEVNNSLNTMKVFLALNESNGVINAACRDERGNFWVGTDTGLYCYDPVQKQLNPIRTNLFDAVSTLCADNRGRIWIGARNQLLAYVVKEHKFIMFGESDGAYANEYLPKSSLLSHMGDVYIGGVTGLLRVKNDIPFGGNPEPSINLLDVVLDGVSVGHNVNPKNNTITIPWDHSSLAVRVIAREKDLMRHKIFRYYIDGLDDQYIESSDYTLTLHSLPQRKYRIRVSCYMKDGNWSVPVEMLCVQIMPPWWKSGWFIFFSVLVVVGGSGIFIWIGLKQHENKLILEMKEHEQKVYEEKIHFLINISHELRTPLTLVYAPLKRILTSGTIQDIGLRKQLTTVFNQARQMKNIINMVLNVRKMEVGYDKLIFHSVRLNDWIYLQAEGFLLEFSAKDIRVAYNFDLAVETVPFDESKCEIVFSNLLMNALKFSEPHSCITLSTLLVGKMVRVSVADEGIGLSEVDISNLFVRFYQGNHDRKGTGIGLSYAKILVELHHGRIGAFNNSDTVNKIGKGATFFYELPLFAAENERICEAKPYLNELLFSPEYSAEQVDSFPLNNYSLLLVEDEPDLRNYLKDTLKDNFNHIYVAEDGIRALDIIRQQHPDVVVSDVMMPRMDGFELCKRIKGELRISHIPVILLTARNDSESTSLGYKLGADVYLSKPFEIDFLLSVIRTQLKNRESVKQKYKDQGRTVLPEESTFSNADEMFLLKLNGLIQENLSSLDLDVKFFTNQMAMSRASLYNKVKALTDMGVSDYINKFRMEKAVWLLLNTNSTILEISEQVGFANQRYFSTAFKQTFEATPSAYRQMAREKDGSEIKVSENDV